MYINLPFEKAIEVIQELSNAIHHMASALEGRAALDPWAQGPVQNNEVVGDPRVPKPDHVRMPIHEVEELRTRCDSLQDEMSGMAENESYWQGLIGAKDREIAGLKEAKRDDTRIALEWERELKELRNERKARSEPILTGDSPPV